MKIIFKAFMLELLDMNVVHQHRVYLQLDWSSNKTVLVALAFKSYSKSLVNLYISAHGYFQ